MRIGKKQTARRLKLIILFQTALNAFLFSSCKPQNDEWQSKISFDDSDKNEAYPHGEFEFLDANPLSPGFDQMFKLKDFQGKYTFWSVECPL